MCALPFPRRGFFMYMTWYIIMYALPKKKLCYLCGIVKICVSLIHQTHKTHFMKTMYCFRVEFENEVAAPISDIFCMTESDFHADPAHDFDYTQSVPTMPTLWGYETFAIADEIRRNQEMASWMANMEIANEDARQKRRAIMSRKFLNA